MATASARKIHIPGIVGVFNPLARRLLRFGVPLGPNALLTVRGRKSGQPRTTPVALVEVEGGRWIIGTRRAAGMRACAGTSTSRGGAAGATGLAVPAESPPPHPTVPGEAALSRPRS